MVAGFKAQLSTTEHILPKVIQDGEILLVLTRGRRQDGDVFSINC